MIFSLAPMEGLTGYIVRNAFHHNFDFIDKYYTPFIPAAKRMNSKIKRDLDPSNNDGITLIPQAMSILADEVISLHEQLKPYGYNEININLGCPSGTVVSKKRGSGILAYPDMLFSFLDDLFKNADFPVSIKTRTGFDDDILWPEIIDIYKNFPIKDLIIHPRVRKDLYKGSIRLDDFALAIEKLSDSPIHLVYNGDITDTESFNNIINHFPSVDEIMIGRGLFMNPALIAEIKKTQYSENLLGSEDFNTRLIKWHDEILEGYLGIFSGSKDAMFRMKEIWMYMHGLFPDHEKLWKKIKKCQTLSDYNSIVSSAFISLG